jgi:hypothetical protein
VGYTKLFSSIIASSIWREDLPTKVVWITMLALKDEQHMVKGSVGGLAHLAGVTKEQCERAIRKFELPDPDSSNPGHQGRKVEPMVGGWLVLNGEFYRKQMSVEDRREYQRVKQAKYRQKKKAGDISSGPLKGELEYLKAERNGAGEVELDQTVTRHLPNAKH